MAEKTASLTVLGGPFAGTRCALPESGTITIGSSEGSTLQLDLPTVSPYHARIEVAGGQVTVHDTGADRALHVNDNPLEPGGTVLRNGDILWLGAPGEEDVVMLQCILPRRPVEAPPPLLEPPPPPEPAAAPSLATTPGPATPTPEIETQALWSLAGTPEAPSSLRVAAEPVREEPTGHEETMAISAEGFQGPAAEPEPPEVAAEVVPARVPEAAAEETPGPAPGGPPEERPDEDLVFAEPSLVGTSENEVAAAIQEGEEVVFADEEAVVNATEVVAPPSPTILMASAEEMGEPQAVSIDFGEGVAIEPEPAIGAAALTVAPEPVFAPSPTVEPEPLFAPQPTEGAEPIFAPEPAVAPEPPVAPQTLPAAPAAPAPPHPPPLPPAHGRSSPTAAKPVGAVPPLPTARPAAPQRPTPAPAARPAHPPAPAARRETRPAAPHAAPHAHATPHTPHAAPRPTPARSAPVATPEGPEVIEAETAPAGSRKSTLLALAGAGGVLVLAGVVWAAWHFLAGRPTPPRPRPTPIVHATPPPAAAPTPTTVPVAVEPTPVPVAAAPIETPTPASTPRATPTPALTPTPRPTATPTPAAARPTPTPAGPSAEALMAQQKALEAQSLLTQAETALRARQYDTAVTNLDSVLRLDPANARATTLRADAVQRRDLARRRFAPGKTVVQGQKAQKAGGLAGFDTGDADLRSSDFLGRVEFEMSPPSAIEAGDAWTLKVYVVNEGKKPIRVSGLVLGTTVNGAGSGGPLPARVREVAPQQRSLVAETTGKWAEGTTSWAAEVTVTGGKGESLKNTLSWR